MRDCDYIFLVFQKDSRRYTSSTILPDYASKVVSTILGVIIDGVTALVKKIFILSAVVVVIICILIFFVWPTILRYKTFEVNGEIKNVKEGYQYVQHSIKDLTTKEISLVSYNVGYRAADLEEDPIPVFYEYEIQIIPDIKNNNNVDMYIVHIDLVKKQLTVILDDNYMSLPEQSDPLEFPNILVMLKAFSEKYGKEVLNPILEKDPEAILCITKPFAFGEFNDKDWEIEFVSDKQILGKYDEPYWEGIYRSTDQRFLDKIGDNG